MSSTMNHEEEASLSDESRCERRHSGSPAEESDREPIDASDSINTDGSIDGDRLRALPKEVGVMLVSVGALGVVLPGIVGVPAVVAGGLILWPKAFGKVDGWLEKRFPKTRRDGMKQIGRFIEDFEKRFPEE